MAENEIASQLQYDLDLSEKPTVDLGPFPFLTEIATGKIASATVRVAEVTLPDRPGVTANDVDAVFSDVTISDQFSSIVAGSAEASALLPYASLSTLSDLDLRYAGPGRVQVRFVLPVSGFTVNGTATGRPVLNVADQTLEVSDAEVSIGSTQLPQAVVDAAGRLALRPIPLQSLPYGLRLTSLTVREDGVLITATGRDLPLR